MTPTIRSGRTISVSSGLFDEFCEYFGHSLADARRDSRDVLDEIEIHNNRIHGYGALNFGRNLSQCYRRLAEGAVDDRDLKLVTAMAHRILDQEVDLMPGVAETLPFLAEKHELTLFTKGHPDEQNRKIDLSGLRPLFAHCEVVKEKNREAYLRLAEVRGFDHEHTWMIGNSPKSDINPALAAGLRAVFVPHERTWTLEREAILPSDGRLIVIERFSDLLRIF